MKRLLDTNICIAFLKGREAGLRDRVVGSLRSELVLCSMVRAELLRGAHRSERVAENLARLATFFANFDSLVFDDLAADHYAVIRAHVERIGQPIGSNDLIIAATALAAGVTLVTRNEREFIRVPGLSVEVW